MIIHSNNVWSAKNVLEREKPKGLKKKIIIIPNTLNKCRCPFLICFSFYDSYDPLASSDGGLYINDMLESHSIWDPCLSYISSLTLLMSLVYTCGTRPDWQNERGMISCMDQNCRI